mmetsp:Transcript_5406/g.22146  ORF Transcript_5406/g.22146 Transcript_5406/m.22146 type:complete len:320 (+) Transcript_5406:2496-3455(+)
MRLKTPGRGPRCPGARVSECVQRRVRETTQRLETAKFYFTARPRPQGDRAPSSGERSRQWRNDPSADVVGDPTPSSTPADSSKSRGEDPRAPRPSSQPPSAPPPTRRLSHAARRPRRVRHQPAILAPTTTSLHALSATLAVHTAASVVGVFPYAHASVGAKTYPTPTSNASRTNPKSWNAYTSPSRQNTAALSGCENARSVQSFSSSRASEADSSDVNARTRHARNRAKPRQMAVPAASARSTRRAHTERSDASISSNETSSASNAPASSSPVLPSLRPRGAIASFPIAAPTSLDPLTVPAVATPSTRYALHIHSCVTA